MQIYTDVEQKSAEWFALKWGRITGSEFKRLVGTDAARKKLALQKRYELANPVEIPEQIPAKPLLWGIEHEPKATARYELVCRDLEYPGFVVHPDLDFIGFSPDGLAEGRGVEIKCPYDTNIHQLTLSMGMPAEHIPQVQGGMWVCGFDVWDFISFDPRMPHPKDFYLQTIRRDEHFIQRLKTNALRVWDMVQSDKSLDVEPDEIPKLF